MRPVRAPIRSSPAHATRARIMAGDCAGRLGKGWGMDLNELQRRALRIHDLYDELNLRERGRVWTREEFMLGFVVI